MATSSAKSVAALLDHMTWVMINWKGRLQKATNSHSPVPLA
jgi:hypothetical protein